MNKILLSAQSISKNYASNGIKTDIISDISLQIRDGDHISIMGASGSGKSTLLSLLAGFDKPSTGQIFFEDQEITHFTETQHAQLRRDEFGFVFQSFYLLPSLTAIENILFPLELQKVGKKQALAQAQSMLEKVGLSHRANNLPHQLSGGERQRVALSRALIHQPKILFADEPTGNLDEKNSEQVLSLLLSLKKDLGTALVMVTHEKSIADLGQTTYRLEYGQLICQTS
jgi:ABC-type lipoprotein export system ATPase subunit